MYIRRKVFSVITDENGEERYFSTTEFINEDSYVENMYSDEAEGALAGAGAAGLGVAGAAGAAYGAKKGISALAKRDLAKREAIRSAAIEDAVTKSKGIKKARKAAENAGKAYKKVAQAGGSEAAAEAWEKKLAAEGSRNTAERAARKAAAEKIKLQDAKGFGKFVGKAEEAAGRAGKFVKNNKKAALAIGAGTVAAGATAGALRKRNRK